ncbi:MAG TPA: hypothetical protein VG078_10455, partial [Acidimicrobiales bacterium]|nr:hypothetical protein [Acidimicrobiales bacterium]
MVLWLNGVCVIGLLAAGLVAVFVVDDEETYPERWDPRVAPLAEFVERERGHRFTHPVHVDFLTAAEYTERTRTDEESLAPEDVEDVEQGEALLRAFGLIAGDVRLLDTVNELSDTGTLAYYDSQEERVVVRGTEITPLLNLTLVHELTHVLQDQVFDLDRFDEDDESVTDGQLAAFQALVEGDADRIESEYFESLSEQEQEAAEGAAEGGAAALEDEEPSQAIAAMFAAPYVLGDALVALLDAVADAKIDEAFVKPPATEEHILDPFKYLDAEGARSLDPPDVGGLEVVDSGDFGAVAVLVVLAERVELRQALTAATGWGGDAYAVFRRDGRTCARINITGDTPSDTEELDAALGAWVAAAPPNTATTTRNGDLVQFE